MCCLSNDPAKIYIFVRFLQSNLTVLLMLAVNLTQLLLQIWDGSENIDGIRFLLDCNVYMIILVHISFLRIQEPYWRKDLAIVFVLRKDLLNQWQYFDPPILTSWTKLIRERKNITTTFSFNIWLLQILLLSWKLTCFLILQETEIFRRNKKMLKNGCIIIIWFETSFSPGCPHIESPSICQNELITISRSSEVFFLSFLSLFFLFFFSYYWIN